MKKFVFVFLTFVSIFSMNVFGAQKSDLECRVYFEKVKSPKVPEQKTIYTMVEQCSVHFSKDSDLVATVIRAYRELFKVNRSHFHLEPFIPFYLKNKMQVDNLVKAISDKTEREDFEERLKTAYREFNEGNG